MIRFPTAYYVDFVGLNNSTLYSLPTLMQQWQKELNNSGFIGIILVDIFRAHDILLHDLIIEKFED